MSSWAGFTDRLRRHAREVSSPRTREYLNVAVKRIEGLEDDVADREHRLDSILRRIKAASGGPHDAVWSRICQNILTENGQ